MRASRSCRRIKKGGNAQDRNTGPGDSNEPCLLFLPMCMELKKKGEIKEKHSDRVEKAKPRTRRFLGKAGRRVRRHAKVPERGPGP